MAAAHAAQVRKVGVAAGGWRNARRRRKHAAPRRPDGGVGEDPEPAAPRECACMERARRQMRTDEAAEGRGLQQILGGLELGRINVAARGVGIARACLLKSVEYSQLRTTFGKPICEHQSIQIKLADMATQVESARLLTEQGALAYDRGERCDMEAGMAKLVASEAALSNSLEAMRLHGAYGYSKEFDIERYYRDAPLLAIGEGTNELQKLIIAKQLLARNPV